MEESLEKFKLEEKLLIDFFKDLTEEAEPLEELFKGLSYEEEKEIKDVWKCKEITKTR